MRMALDLALKGKGKTSPNPMVGAVVVRGERVVAEGWHRRCGSDHAEIAALKKAGAEAKGARLYVTLEPCFHYGRTPPCVDVVIQSGVREVVIAMKDPNPLTNGQSIAKLRRAGIPTRVGLLGKEAGRINEVFVKYIKTGMPFAAAKCAQTLDGKIATVTGESKWITSLKTRDYARRVRDEFDAILVGVNTVLKDDPGLNGKNRSRPLKKIILDSSLKISLKAGLFLRVEPSHCLIAVTKKAPLQKIKHFQRRGIHVIVCPERQGCVDLKWLFEELGRREITSILIEGGARVIGSALRDHLVDKMYVYIAPKIIGDQDALSSVAGIPTVDVNKSIFLRDMTFQRIDQDVLITGYPKRR